MKFLLDIIKICFQAEALLLGSIQSIRGNIFDKLVSSHDLREEKVNRLIDFVIISSGIVGTSVVFAGAYDMTQTRVWMLGVYRRERSLITKHASRRRGANRDQPLPRIQTQQNRKTSSIERPFSLGGVEHTNVTLTKNTCRWRWHRYVVSSAIYCCEKVHEYNSKYASGRMWRAKCRWECSLPHGEVICSAKGNSWWSAHQNHCKPVFLNTTLQYTRDGWIQKWSCRIWKIRCVQMKAAWKIALGLPQKYMRFSCIL